MDADSPLANVVEIVVPIAAFGFVATPVVIAALKGRWLAAVVGLVGFLTGFATMFGLFGIAEPSEEFQSSNLFGVVSAALVLMLFGGAFLLVASAVRNPRAGSWWEQRRPTRLAASRRNAVQGGENSPHRGSA